MFPNADSLPLSPQPNLEQYKKRAKDLVKACKTGDPAAVKRWTNEWLEALARAQGRELTPAVVNAISRRGKDIREFLDQHLAKEGRGLTECRLADAQFVIARSHGFASWTKFAGHLEGLTQSNSPVSEFERAVDAIVDGEAETLARLLRGDPSLIRARSTREHHATLLHYTAANGVENYRQKTPKNIVAITRMLLKAGAEVDAEADLYGGGSTTLGLAATSIHPYKAGVQNELMQVLLDHGAAIDHQTAAGNRQKLVLGCLANGRGAAAVYLAERGAELDLKTAGGVGRLDLVRSYFNEDGTPKPPTTEDQANKAFLYACGWGRNDVVRYFLNRGVDLSAHGGDGQTALHWAGIGGQLETITLLLQFGPPLEARNMYGGAVLGQTLWSAAHGGDPEVYAAIIEALLAAGAQLGDRYPPINPRIDELLAQHGSTADPTLYWYGEGPVDE